MSNKRIYLIRHAHTVWNGPPHRVQGQYDSDLSDQGRAAAIALGRSLQQPDRIVSSPAARCLQTVDCLFGRIPDTTDARCLEIDLGWFCGELATDIDARDPESWQAWQHTPARIRPGGGETLAEVQARFVEAVQQIQADATAGQRLLIATHGGCLRTLICYDRDAPLDMYPDIAMENLSMYMIAGQSLQRGGLNLRRVAPHEFV